MKKNPLVPILGGGVIAALVLGVMAVIVLVDAGLLHLLGVRCDSFGWLVLYVLVEAVLGLPLELFTAGLTKALVKLGWASPRLANLLYIPLDALCTVFAFGWPICLWSRWRLTSSPFWWWGCCPPCSPGR